MGVIRDCLEKYTGIEWNSLGEVVDVVADTGRNIYERYSGPAREFAVGRVVDRLVERYQQEPSMREEYGLEDPDGIEDLREELRSYCLEGKGKESVNRALGADLAIASSSIIQILLDISNRVNPNPVKTRLIYSIEAGENLLSRYLLRIPLSRRPFKEYQDEIGTVIAPFIADRKKGLSLKDYIGAALQVLSQYSDIVGFNSLNTVADNTIYRGFPDSLGLEIKREQPVSRVETEEKPVYDETSIQSLLAGLSPDTLSTLIRGLGDKLKIPQQPQTT